MADEIYEINNKNTNMRVDKFLAKYHKDYSRSYIQKLIDDDKIKVNNSFVDKSYKLKQGDIVKLFEAEDKELELEPYEMDLDIIYEDKHLIVINKEAGILVHPSPHERKKTLVNALLNYTDDLSAIGGVKRPGIVHRLDKDTSGAIVVAKDDKSHRSLVEEFKNRNTKKIYRAITLGKFKYEKVKVDAPIGRDPNNRTKMKVRKRNSKKAVTEIKLLNKNKDYSYLQMKLLTGRTHQIRVHLSYLNNPILGDSKYGGISEEQELKKVLKRQMLHAHKLAFYHPINNEWMEFSAKLPEDFKNVLKKTLKIN